MEKLRFTNPHTLETFKTVATRDAVECAELLGLVPTTTEDADKCREIRGQYVRVQDPGGFSQS